MNPVTKQTETRTETYWTNAFGGRFKTEYEAERDYGVRSEAQWQVEIIPQTKDGRSGRSAVYDALAGSCDAVAMEYSGGPAGRCRVTLCRDVVAKMQALIAQHGDNVGYAFCPWASNSQGSDLVLLSPFDSGKRFA